MNEFVALLIPPWFQSDTGRVYAELIHLAVACAVALCSGLIAAVGWVVRFIVKRAVANWDRERQEIHEAIGDCRREIADLRERCARIEA